MKFLLDAQLPRRLGRLLSRHGHTALHTLDLPNKNRTSDTEILRYADAESCVVTTKDADFVDAFHLRKTPQRLLLISTGNITNADLDALFESNIATIVQLFQSHQFIEINRTDIIIHT